MLKVECEKIKELEEYHREQEKCWIKGTRVYQGKVQPYTEIERAEDASVNNESAGMRDSYGKERDDERKAKQQYAEQRRCALEAKNEDFEYPAIRNIDTRAPPEPSKDTGAEQAETETKKGSVQKVGEIKNRTALEMVIEKRKKLQEIEEGFRQSHERQRQARLDHMLLLGPEKGGWSPRNKQQMDRLIQLLKEKAMKEEETWRKDQKYKENKDT